MADEELTQCVTGAAQSPADLDKTEVVPRTPPPGTPVDSADGEKTTRVGSQPPPTPQPAAPPPVSGAGQPHRAPAPPRQPYGPAASRPTPPPPYVGPRGAAPQTPPPPQGYGTPPPPPPGYGAPPPLHQPYAAGPPVPPPHGYGPNTSQNPMEAANALLAKGNSLITRLMYRGIRGELIRQPWFANIRQQSADPFVYITYGVGLLLAVVFALMPGVISTLITTWSGPG